MGTSTDAILCFGIDLGEGFDPPLYTPDDPDDGPADHVGECDLFRHCSYECPMYMLAAPGSKLVAHRGHPKEVSGLELNITAQRSLDDAMRELGLPPQPGKWLLCSLWGV